MLRDDMNVQPASHHEPSDGHGDVPHDHQHVDSLSRERQEALREFWSAVKRMPAYVRLAASLAKDPDVPHRARAMLAVGGAYMVSPIDLVPGVIPVAGQLDDVYVLLVAIRQSLRMCPHDVAERHLERQGIDRADLDHDLAAIRRLVKVGVVTGARWGMKRLKAVRARLSNAIATRRKGSE